MREAEPQPSPMSLRDCELVVLVTGISVIDLRSLRDALLRVDAASIYHHFWGRLLQPLFDEPEFNNDLASWAFRSLNDKTLAERLSVIDPTDFATLEDLRSDLVDLVEARIEEADRPTWNLAHEPFYFLRSQIVVFDAHRSASSPRELAEVLPELSVGSIFYHFIDARRRTPNGQDDFTTWLADCGEACQPLIDRISSVDPYFSSLAHTQFVLGRILKDFTGAA
jgi:hypothetical protein